jgi:hypothetical protein
MIHLNAVEVAWITINVIAATMTIAALLEARHDWAVLRKFNGSARGVVARGTIRRETFRLLSQLALLAIALPAVFSDREIVLTPTLILLLSVPVFILANTISDRRTRNVLHAKLEEDIVKERDASLDRLRTELNADADARAAGLNARADEREAAANVRADDHAKVAGARAAVVTKRADEIKVTADETAVEVHEIHDATVPE